MQRIRFVKNAREQCNDQQDYLQPLPTPERPWTDISMDFIVELPRTSKGNTGILVVIDCFSKMAHFITTQPELNAFTTARILFENIVTKHGIPLSIVSDQDSRFGSAVWRELWKMLDTNLDISTAYHP